MAGVCYLAGVHLRRLSFVGRLRTRSVTSTGSESEMKFVSFIWADGMPAPQDLAVIQRELPAWVKDVDSRGVRLFGRELDLPDTAATVRVRDGETLVTDGPFAETKEFVAGFDLLECADISDAIEAAVKCPIALFQAIEIRPFLDGTKLSEEAFAFGRADASAASPYLLSMWSGGRAAAQVDDQAVKDQGEAWRQTLVAHGNHVLGSALGGADTAVTVRVRDGKPLLSNGPCTGIQEFIAGI